MKKIVPILFLFFFFNPFSGKAQYIPLVKDSVHWLVAGFPGAWGIGTYASIYEYYSIGDTIVNSTTYKKVYKRPIESINNYYSPYQATGPYSLFALLREDISAKEVYSIILQPTGLYCPNNQEILLYNFNVVLGDTLNSCTSYNLHPCPQITSISPGTYGNYNTIIYELGGCSYNSRYYEGIGGWDGLFENQNDLYGSMLWEYCIGSGINCGLTTNITETTINNSFEVYPNPNNGAFTIEINDFESAIIEIYTISGQLIWQQLISNHITVVGLSTQPKGIYFAKIATQNNTIVEKIVIQ